MNLGIDFNEQSFDGMARIKVVGVGGGGSNAVRRMIEADLVGVEFYVVNTDVQALRACENATRVQIGADTTNGLGAGADPDKGRRAAEEDREKLREVVSGADMVFITAGMGGGTGTGAAPIIAGLAKETSALTIGVVTRPFNFEGQRRSGNASNGIDEIRSNTDSVIIVPNERLTEHFDRKMPLRSAFHMVDDVLLNAVQSISDLIMIPGEINLDFADVKSVMSNSGSALMGVGVASGENRAEVAAQNAISSPLLEENSIINATGIIVNITGHPELAMHEMDDAMNVLKSEADPEQLIFGLAYDESRGDEMQVTVIATGFEGDGDTRTLAQRDSNDLYQRSGQSSRRVQNRQHPSSERPLGRNPFNTSPRQQAGAFASAPSDDAYEDATFLQQPTRQETARRNSATSSTRGLQEHLDIPTFLRVREQQEQADLEEFDEDEHRRSRDQRILRNSRRRGRRRGSTPRQSRDS